LKPFLGVEFEKKKSAYAAFMNAGGDGRWLLKRDAWRIVTNLIKGTVSRDFRPLVFIHETAQVKGFSIMDSNSPVYFDYFAGLSIFQLCKFCLNVLVDDHWLHVRNFRSAAYNARNLK
jgi:hypothetical protein